MARENRQCQAKNEQSKAHEGEVLALEWLAPNEPANESLKFSRQSHHDHLDCLHHMCH